ncbi:MAG: HEAT repeat domain-containing protein, partial [Gemmatimonadetes bacterium]|nr:HEAT repeat domain-containing protein [Gemmatimonadota bacterium]
MRGIVNALKTLLAATSAAALVPAPAASQRAHTPIAAAPAYEAITGQALDERLPPPGWAQQDTAEAVYKSAREALNRGEHVQAARLFRRIPDEYPKSAYAPDALYWEAFALYRHGGSAELRSALRALERQKQRYPQAVSRGDAEALAVRIRGALARLGDTRAAEQIAAAAAEAAKPPRPPTPPRAARPAPPAKAPAAPPAKAAVPGAAAQACPADEEDDIRSAVLNALLQMNAELAVPVLRDVLARRDACAAPLRRRAIFLLSQKRTEETAEIMLGVAREDPDREVRKQAVFWLSQVPTQRAVGALEEILKSSDDTELQKQALFALSQHRSEQASQALRAYATRTDAPGELREQAIFWLGQHRSEANAEFLRGLYGRLDSPELKEKIFFSLSQMRSAENAKWLLGVAGNEKEPLEARKKALFWASQGGATTEDLVGLYDRMQDREMKEQLIFAYSQKRDAAAVDKLMDIARRDPDRELRKKAIFWLGQSNDPRVAR